MNYAEFKKKIKSMTAHDIIMAMVEGLRNPRIEIDMGTFGKMENGICYGCAATNAVLSIMDANTAEKVVYHVLGRNSDAYWAFSLKKFEAAIDRLRCGGVGQYNLYAKDCGIAQITPMPGQKLPRLGNDYTEDQLHKYVELAEYQLKTF